MSDKDYSNRDALKIALNLEKEGYDFYAAASANATDAKVKKIFLMLANEEKKHLNIIRNIQDGIIDPITYFISDEAVVEDYLRRIIETNVFKKADEIDKITEKIETDKDAIRLAMQAEKDSLDFFTKMAELTRDRDGQMAFRQLASYEEHHLEELQRLQDYIARLEKTMK